MQLPVRLPHSHIDPDRPPTTLERKQDQRYDARQAKDLPIELGVRLPGLAGDYAAITNRLLVYQNVPPACSASRRTCP